MSICLSCGHQRDSCEICGGDLEDAHVYCDALRFELGQVRGERDEAIEEMEGAVKLREAADACITRLEASCYQWQAENRALYERAASQCAICEDKNECDGCPYEGFAQLAPLAAAAAERVAKMEEALAEDVEECAAWCDVDEGCLVCYRFDTCKKRAALDAKEEE